MKLFLLSLLVAVFCLYGAVEAVPKYCRHNSAFFQQQHPFYIGDYSGTRYRVNQTNFAINHTAAEVFDLSVRDQYLLRANGIFDFYQDNYWAGDTLCYWVSTLFFSLPGVYFGVPDTTWIFLVDYHIQPLGPSDDVTKKDNVPQSRFTKISDDFDFIGYFGQGESEISNEVDKYGVCNHFVNDLGQFTKTTNPHNPGGPGYPHRFYISGDVGYVAKFGGPMIYNFLLLLGSKVTSWDRPEIQPLLDSWRDGSFECLEIDMGFGLKCYNIAILSDLPSEKRGINAHARARAMVEGRSLSVDWENMPFQYPLTKINPASAASIANGRQPW